LCKRMRHRFPDLKLVVGRWDGSEQDGPAWQQLRDAGADQVDATLEGTRAYLSAWRAVFSAGPTPTQSDGRAKPGSDRAIGTVPA
jgi:hypothetical protein